MLHTDERFAEAVEKAVGEIEAATDADIVVVAARRSGTYRDLTVLVGVAAAWLALVFALYSPWSFSGNWLPIELPIVGLLTAWAAARSPALLRTLAGRTRCQRQVAEAAGLAFRDEAVHGTRGRTGVLVYLSALERRVVLLPDAGIEARVPGAEWNVLRWGSGADPSDPTDLEGFLAGLHASGAVLARYVPPTGDNPNEIANAPRIRP